MLRLNDSCIDVASDVIHLRLSVEIPSNNIVSFNESIKFLLKVLVLMGQKSRVLLKGFILCLEVKISIHQSLVRIINSLKICIVAPLINLQTIVFGLA